MKKIFAIAVTCGLLGAALCGAGCDRTPKVEVPDASDATVSLFCDGGYKTVSFETKDYRHDDVYQFPTYEGVPEGVVYFTDEDCGPITVDFGKYPFSRVIPMTGGAGGDTCYLQNGQKADGAPDRTPLSVDIKAIVNTPRSVGTQNTLNNGFSFSFDITDEMRNAEFLHYAFYVIWNYETEDGTVGTSETVLCFDLKYQAEA